MSWEDLDKKPDNKKQLEAAATLAQIYAVTFSTDSGKKVIEDLTNRFIMSNDTPLTAQNPEYESGYHSGEAGVVKYLIHQMTAAKTR